MPESHADIATLASAGTDSRAAGAAPTGTHLSDTCQFFSAPNGPNDPNDPNGPNDPND